MGALPNNDPWGGPLPAQVAGVPAIDLIYAALRIIQVLGAPDRTPSAGMVSDGVKALNSLRDSWNTERLTIHTIRRDTFPMVASQASYTIGSGGNFNTTRPIRIEYAGILDSDNLETPVTVLRDIGEWAAVRAKTTESSLPYQLWYEPSAPLGVIHLYPVPITTDDLVLYVWQQATEITDPSANIALPPGYQRALEYGLAVELAPRFPQARLTPLAVQTAIDAKAAIKRANLVVPLLGVDEAMLLRGQRFNIWTGE